jgi:hypothetical protein
MKIKIDKKPMNKYISELKLYLERLPDNAYLEVANPLMKGFVKLFSVEHKSTRGTTAFMAVKPTDFALGLLVTLRTFKSYKLVVDVHKAFSFNEKENIKEKSKKSRSII